MITPEYVQTMARYNQWQNRNLYDAADTLGDAPHALCVMQIFNHQTYHRGQVRHAHRRRCQAP